MKNKLTEPQQLFIVQQLACFMTYAGVVAAVKEEFSLDVSRHLVREYDALKNEKLAEKWRLIFAETRKQFLNNTASVGISHRAYRLSQLQRLFDRAGKNPFLRLQILEQAAKEMGGLFTKWTSSHSTSSAKQARQSRSGMCAALWWCFSGRTLITSSS